ncbi:uncharacterized protein K02A2.6-like [Macrosteles quadrilineatus]|uniref:uncharacterized protein K02A2.6-like n=1 Tax=Macrosteles quadrilineatus TaxID=74068 RepID=UPI0023E28FCB|nr:uncharacterized protein K02A2.6-like [Macrosteles quadrilineatus]
MPQPRNIDEVRKFLGMVTYYARFIPDLSTKTTPLRQLLQKNRRFHWSIDCQTAFDCLKEEITSKRVLVPYDPHRPIVLTYDASPTGIAAVSQMSHIIDDEEKPIAYASRSLTPSERNYSQLDREALATVFGVSHFYNYLYGLHFTLITDNAPLSRIFHESKSLPPMTSSRLLRYASFLSGFNYSIRFKKGEANANVDCLSRAPVTQHSETLDIFLNNEVTLLHSETIFEISSTNLNATILARETEADQNLREIKRKLLSSSTDLPYTLDNGVLFKETRAVIPNSLQPQVLQQLHATHVGITKMKQLARRYVYWQGIDKDIEKLVQSCEICAHIKFNPPKAPLHPWVEPEENWERIHIDYAGPFQNHYFLVCVCAKSKWVEVKVLRNAPTTSNTIILLDNIFSSNGYPQVMVSDNATIFTSAEFKKYCSSNGIFQKLIAPGHAATNGLAERTIQTLKQRLKALEDDHRQIHTKVQEILQQYRATPLSNGQSPAERYLHRRIRIKLDALQPYHPAKNPPSIIRIRTFNVGERVLFREYSQNNKYIWTFDEIIQKLGTLQHSWES